MPELSDEQVDKFILEYPNATWTDLSYMLAEEWEQ